MKSLICFFVLIFVAAGFGAVIPTFEPWAGAPADCAPYLAGKTIYYDAGSGATQAIIAAQLTAGITALNATGPSCRAISISSICKYSFPTFDGTTVFPACASNCLDTLQYCLQSFVLFTGAIPSPFNNCGGTGWYPIDDPAHCTLPISTTSLPPSWDVEPFSLSTYNATLKPTYKKVYDYCTPYVTGNIFVSDQATQSVLGQIVLPKLLALEAARNTTLPYACFDATVELICKTAYSLGVDIIPGSLGSSFPPVDFYLPRPPCDNVCKIQNNQCAEAFYLGGVAALSQLVNCSGPSSLPGFIQYPNAGWTFPFPTGGYLLPCVPAANLKPKPTFRCEDYDKSISGKTCSKYIDYPIWIPPASTSVIATLGGATPSQAVLAKIAEPLLKASKALPDFCRQNQEELICKNVFASCSVTKFNISTRNPPIAFDFTYGGAPCKSVCTIQNKQCAQLLSLTGNSASIPDCDEVDPSTGVPTYPSKGVDFQNGLFVPCVPPTVPHQPKPFTCEKFKGKPSACKPYVDYEFMTTPDFTQDYLAKQVAAGIEGTDTLPDGCKEPLIEYACHTGFQRCQVEKASGVTFDFGSRPCRSHCDKVVKQCGGLFVLAGKSANIPDCAEIDTTDGQKSNPKKSLKYSAFGKEWDIKCNPSEVKTPSQEPVRCEKLDKGADFCKKYVSQNVFASDPIPQSTAVTVASQFNQLLLEAPESCRDYALNLACNVMFQECEEVQEDGFKMVVVHPPCKNLCTDMPSSCKDYFKLYGIPFPDCSEKDPITGQPRYTSKWSFELGKKKIVSDCRKGSRK